MTLNFSMGFIWTVLHINRPFYWVSGFRFGTILAYFGCFGLDLGNCQATTFGLGLDMSHSGAIFSIHNYKAL